MHSPWLHRCAVALAASSFGILAGGIRPPADLVVLALAAVVAAWLGSVKISSGIKYLGFVSFLAAGSICALPASGMLRACVAHLLFATTTAIALGTSRSWAENTQYVEDSGWPSLRSMACFSAVIVGLQVMLGAAYRNGVTSALPHVIGSIIVTAIVLIVSIFVLTQFGSHAALRRWAMILLGTTSVQVVLGIFAFLTKVNGGASHLTTAHVANGAFTLAASILLAMQIFRNVQPQLSEAAQDLSPVSR